MKSEPLTVLDMHSGFLCCRSQMVGEETGSVERFPAPFFHRRKNEVGCFCVERLLLPCAKMPGQDGMQRDITVRCIGPGFSVLSLGPALGNPYPPFLPEHVAPAQRRRRTGEHERAVKRGGEGLAGLGTRLDVCERILRDDFMQDADLVDAVHEAPHFRDRRAKPRPRAARGGRERSHEVLGG